MQICPICPYKFWAICVSLFVAYRYPSPTRRVRRIVGGKRRTITGDISSYLYSAPPLPENPHPENKNMSPT
jgi:hypothetical protein